MAAGGMFVQFPSRILSVSVCMMWCLKDGVGRRCDPRACWPFNLGWMLRDALLPMTLDIEHFTKIRLIAAAESAGEDG